MRGHPNSFWVWVVGIKKMGLENEPFVKEVCRLVRADEWEEGIESLVSYGM
jgi:hypothetical protein